MDQEEKKKTKKGFRFPIRVKMALLIIIFGALLAEIAMIYFTLVTSNNNKEDYKNTATGLSNTVALLLDKDKAKTLTDEVVSLYELYGKPLRPEGKDPKFDEYLSSFDIVKSTPTYRELKKDLYDVKIANPDVDGVYLGYVDVDLKRCLYILYDEENEAYPVGMVDPLYEEDYPLIDNPMLGFVASIYESELDGGWLVTVGAPVVGSDGNIICYALVDISMDKVRGKQADSIIRLFLYLMGTVVGLSIIGIVVAHFSIVKPVKTLQNAAKSYDVENPEKTHEIFSNLKIKVHDEFRDLAASMKEMEGDVYNRMNELVAINAELSASQAETKKMTELANKDGLTGVRNKIAYDNFVEGINKQIASGEKVEFGIAMVDLNYLKMINDEYGHMSGDIALIRLSNLVCTVFAHSPVFRVGGDEFAIVLRRKDYQNADALIAEFNERVHALSIDEHLTPAEKANAAIGYSAFDPEKDTSVEDVFQRADELMYERKRRMKEGKE